MYGKYEVQFQGVVNPWSQEIYLYMSLQPRHRKGTSAGACCIYFPFLFVCLGLWCFALLRQDVMWPWLALNLLGSHDDLEFLILLPSFPVCWDYRYLSNQASFIQCCDQSRASHMLDNLPTEPYHQPYSLFVFFLTFVQLFGGIIKVPQFKHGGKRTNYRSLSFHHVGPRQQTQAFRFGGKHP